MKDDGIIGIDMGGTHLRAAMVNAGKLSTIHSLKVPAKGSEAEVLHTVFEITDSIFNNSVTGIGIGVPGLTSGGILYDVFNIPSWTQVPLQQLMEQRYQVPVSIDNDANCFALGEYYFGKGNGCNAMIGLTVGTGLGAGIIINKNLYSGSSGGAGEFGMIDYLDYYFEYYASGQFFKNVYDVDGQEVFKRANLNDTAAMNMYEVFGTHLGNAIKMMLYAFDIKLIIIGGSLKHAFPFYSATMWHQINTIKLKRIADALKIQVSELENSGILGSAALLYDIS